MKLIKTECFTDTDNPQNGSLYYANGEYTIFDQYGTFIDSFNDKNDPSYVAENHFNTLEEINNG